MLRELDERTLVSGQIAPDEVAELKQRGVTLIVNNRPDGEDPGQPDSAEVELAARAAGIGYRHIPVAGRISQDQVAAMRQALEGAEGQVLAYCRVGMRSAFLWALARDSAGEDPETLIRAGAEAGYDLSAVRRWLS